MGSEAAGAQGQERAAINMGSKKPWRGGRVFQRGKKPLVGSHLLGFSWLKANKYMPVAQVV